MKILVFDMDGTIVDFYGVNNWLEKIKAEKIDPYKKAKPIYNMTELNSLLRILKSYGWYIVITSWLAGGQTSMQYDRKVKTAKINWLQKYNFPADEIHIVKYGTPKEKCTCQLGGYQILIDDNAEVRNNWNLGKTIDANKDIIAELRKLLD